MLWLAAGRDWRPALRVALSAALALALAHAAFYGRLVLELLAQPGSGGMSFASRLAALAHPRRWFWDEVGVYFTGLHLAAAAWGIVRVWRRLTDRVERAWLVAWGLASIALLAFQSLSPLLSFYRGAFLFSPLICIGCGVAVVSLWRRGRAPGRLAALALVAVLLAAQGAKILGLIPAFFQAHDAHIPGPWLF